MGLKFGMYSSAGYYTCARYGRLFGTCTQNGGETDFIIAASLGKEHQDANTFADWGVDYLSEIMS